MAAEQSQTILVVEDDAALRRMIAMFLRAAGYHVREAADGVEGLVSARDDPPDLVLLDLMMPGLNGWDVLRRLKGGLSTAQVPVIVLTASVGATLTERALSLGAARYLVKPLDTRALIEAVNQVLGRPNGEDIPRG